MQEKILDNQQFENPEEGIEKKEGGVFSKFGKKLVELGKKFEEKPKKLSRAVALMLLLRASTAFGEANMERPQMKDTSSLQGIGETLDVSPQFDWKEFIKNVEVSYGVESSLDEKDDFEVVKGPSWYYTKDSNFYEKMTIDEYDNMDLFFEKSIKDSKSVGDYFNTLSVESKNFNDLQKVHYIQKIGGILHSTYNYDMLKKDDYVRVSDEDMFQEIKKEYEGNGAQSGICGNIHTFMAKIARNMGIEAWTQDDRTEDGSHIFMGAIAKSDTNSQIVFSDYNDVVPTNTLNYQKALGIAERYHGGVSMFLSTVSNPDGTEMFVKSLATEKMEEAAGIVDVEERFSNLFSENKREDKGGLKIELANETKKVEFSKGTIGLSFYDYENAGNPYNSLESLQGLRLGFQDKDQGQNFEANVSILHLNINDLNNEKLSQTEIVGEVFGEYLKDIKLNKGEYERFKLKLGATLNSVIGYSIKSEQFEVKGEYGAGAQLVYVDPSEAGKIWVGAEAVGRYQKNNMQEQDLTFQNTLTKFKLGTEVEVREGVITNLEASYGKTPWGKKTGFQVGVETDKLKVSAELEKQNSQQERFFPDKEKIGGSIGYNTPIGEIDIYGALEKEQYKDAKEEKNWKAGLKYRIILWK